MANGSELLNTGDVFHFVATNELLFTSAILGNSVSDTVGVVNDFGIGTGTTTPAKTDTALTTPITAWYSGADYKDLSSSVVIDVSLKTLERRALIAYSEANGNDITEVITRSSSTTPVPIFKAVFDAYTKSAEKQLIIVIGEAII